MIKSDRGAWANWLLNLLIAMIAAFGVWHGLGGVAQAQAPATTTVSDVVYSATGTPIGGILLISWPAFTTAGGQGVPAGQTSAVVGSDGQVNVALIADAGAQPFGAAYKVVYKLNDGTTHVEYWIVPVSVNAVTIATVRAQQLPPSVAAQTATKQYVDSAVAGALGSGGGGANGVNRNGDTMLGPLGLVGDPTAPNHAADKHYVDAQVAGATVQIGTKLGRVGDTPASLADARYASQFTGVTVGDQIDAACADLNGRQGVVVVPSSMAAGWSRAGVADNCLIRDERGAGGSSGTNFYKGIDFYGRYTATVPGLNLIQPLLIEGDAYAGGVNAGTVKTQYGAIHAEFDARTVGERKNVVGFMRCQGKGDCIGSAFWAQDWGGFGANGDEGNEGGRFEADQADDLLYPVPAGQVSGVNGSAVTVSWSGGSNAYLGEARPLINLSRGVYAAGTVASVGLVSGSCTVTGSGTGWATTFGAGAHQDVFLEITGNDGAHLRWTVPVLQIVDDTHVVIEYSLVEVGASCLSQWVTQSGAYKMYRGGTVASLGAVIAGTKAPAAVNLATGASWFQSGDSVEEPVGYNYHGSGVVALVSRDIGEPQGAGVYAGNLGQAAFQTAFRSSGPFLNGLLIDSVLGQDGLVFTKPVGGGFGALLKSNDSQSANTRLMFWVNGVGAQRTIDYNRTAEVLSLPGGQNFSTSSAQVGIGTSPVAGSLMYMYNGTASQTGLTVANSAASGNAAQIVTTNASGIAGFKTSPVLAEFNNGMNVVGYSGNESGQTWSVSSADGSASFGNTSISGKMNLGTSVALNDNSASVYGVGLNAGGLPGVSFNATGATRKFGIYGGSPGNSNGTLQFWDWTAGQSILNYDGTTWNMPKALSVTGKVTASTGFQNNGGATWTTGAGNPTGGCTTGSMYSRTDATSNAAALFVCVSSAWTATGGSGGGGGGSKWSGTSYPIYSVVASGTRYFAFGSSGNYSSLANMAPGWAGTLSNFCMYVASTQPAGGAITLTLYLNGSPTALTASVVSGTNGVQCDTTHSVTVAATDLIGIQAVNGSTSAAGVVQSVTVVIQ